MKKLSDNPKIVEKRRIKDAEALAKLEAWCKPLSMTVYDDGWQLSLKMLDVRVYIGEIRDNVVKYWGGRQTIAAAANKLLRAIAGGTEISFRFQRRITLDDGSEIYDDREYSFKIPKSSSPEELTLKLDLAGWKPPEDIWKLEDARIRKIEIDEE